jgi:Asp-tRNA(Asn)/Glu-tRNA(Gln) amidotransferase C subunit
MKELSSADVAVLARIHGLTIEGPDLIEVTNRLNNFISGVEHLDYFDLEGIDPVIFRSLEEF